MRKKSIRAARKRTPPAMPTPRPILTPVLEGPEGEGLAPLPKGELEFDEDDEALGEVTLAEEVGLVVDAVAEAALLVDGGPLSVVGVDEVAPTYSTVEGTDAVTITVVVGV
jgi:hypothetical protein